MMFKIGDRVKFKKSAGKVVAVGVDTAGQIAEVLWDDVPSNVPEKREWIDQSYLIKLED